MDRAKDGRNGTSGLGAGDDPSSAAVFAVLWGALADLLGTAATAMLVRRAAQRGAKRDPALAAIIVARESLEYRYTLPPAWKESLADTDASLRQFFAELVPLLVELTGPVAVRHLAQVPALRERGFVSSQEDES